MSLNNFFLEFNSDSKTILVFVLALIVFDFSPFEISKKKKKKKH